MWSDDLVLHGHGLARWITDYVDFEESLAVGSMAQEDLAHAAALMSAAGCSAEDRDWRIYERPLEAWAPSALLAGPARTWPDTVAQAVLLAEAAAVVVERLTRLGDEVVARTAAVMRGEQELHVRHWHRWVRVLARDRKTGDEFLAALRERAEQCGDLFGDPPTTPGQPRSDALDALSMHADWRGRVAGSLLALGAEEVPLPEGPVARRAPAPGAPLEGVLRGMRSVRSANPAWHYEIHE
jgi:1,2-phenylacetyl-CoA epoxidase catalytic subunit